jgi:hypothetical protein
MTWKFTPGPWECEMILPEDDAAYVIGKSDREIAKVPLTRNRKVAVASAHLIAAAPDGYALAEQYRNDMMFPNLDEDQRQRRIEAIDAFLKKARGEQ